MFRDLAEHMTYLLNAVEQDVAAMSEPSGSVASGASAHTAASGRSTPRVVPRNTDQTLHLERGVAPASLGRNDLRTLVREGQRFAATGRGVLP